MQGAASLVALAAGSRPARAYNGLESWAGSLPLDQSLRTVDLAAITLGDFRGRVLLVHFFASWCEPCREEMPKLQRLADRASNLGVLGIAVGEDVIPVRRFLAKMPVRFTIALDPERSFTRAAGVLELPTTIVLDPDLRARRIVRGQRAWDDFDEAALVRELTSANTN